MSSVTEVLQNNYLLVSLHCKKPTQQRVDQSANAAVANHMGTRKGKFTTHKKIWADSAVEIKTLIGLIAAAEGTHKHLTAPWAPFESAKTGIRLCKNERFFEYVQKMNKHKATIITQLDLIESRYDKIIADSMAELNRGADASLYPSFAQFRATVGLKFSYKPIPSTEDFSRINLPGNAVSQMVALAEANMQAEIGNVINSAWKAIVAPLDSIIKQTGKEKGRIYDSLFENLRPVVAAMADFNLKDDPAMENMRLKLDRLLSVHNLDDVRKDTVARSDLHSDASKVMDAMSDLGW